MSPKKLFYFFSILIAIHACVEKNLPETNETENKGWFTETRFHPTKKSLLFEYLDQGVFQDFDLDSLSLLPKESLPSLKCLEGIENFEKLTYLSVPNQKLKNIKGVENLKNLKELDLQNNSISKVPDLSGLEELEILDLSKNELENIEFLRDAKSLRILKLSDNEIQSIEVLKSLTNLEELYLSENNIENIDILKKLDNLKILTIKNNLELKSSTVKLDLIRKRNPDFYKNLIKLEIDTDKKIEDIESLDLALDRSEDLIDIQAKLDTLKTLDGIEFFVNLKTLHLKGQKITDLKPIADLKNIENLDIRDLNLDASIFFIWLKSIKYLKFSEDKLPTWKEFLKLSNLVDPNPIPLISKTELKSIQGNNRTNTILLHNPELYKVLQKNNIVTDTDIVMTTELIIKDNEKLDSLEGLEFFRNLKSLEIERCPNVSDLTPIKNLIKISRLRIRDSSIESISCLENLRNLQHLNIARSKKFNTQLSVLNNFNDLEDLSLHECNIKDSDIKVLEGLKHLKRICLGNNQISDISSLKNSSQSIEELYIYNNQISDISLLSNVLHLKSLYLGGNNIKLEDKIQYLKVLEFNTDKSDIKNEFKTLNPALFKVLDLENSENLYKDISERKIIDIDKKGDLTSLEGLQYFTELKTLNIENCKKIKNLDPINNLVNLEHLYIKNCDNIEDVSFLKKLENLKQFCLINSRNVKGNLSVLERFKKLESLCLNGCNLRDSDIRVLGNLKHLKEVYLGNNQITDISH